MSVDEEEEVIGGLKVSVEAAKALTGIYREFHQEPGKKTEEESDEEEDERAKEQIQLIECDSDDF